MAKCEMLLLCPTNGSADLIVQELRQHGFGIHPCSKFEAACQVLETRPVMAVLVLSTVSSQEMEAVLAYRMNNHRHLPIFFVAVTEFPNMKRLLDHTGVIFLPSKPSPSDLDRLLVSTGAYTTPPWQRFYRKLPENLLVTIKEDEYPIRFQAAKAKFEKLFVERVLRIFHGNVSRTSQAIDMGRRNVQVKIHRYNIPLKKIREEFTF